MTHTTLIEVNTDLVVTSIESAARSEWAEYNSITVDYRAVALDSLVSLISIVNRNRLTSAEELLNLYEESNIDVYAPTALGNSEILKTLLPPVIEQSEHGVLIIDGVHRCLVAHLRGYHSVNAVTIQSKNKLPQYAGQDTPLIDISPADSAETQRPLFTGQRTINPLFRPGEVIVAGATRRIEQTPAR